MLIDDILFKVDDEITITKVTNGYLVATRGENFKEETWVDAKLIANDFSEVVNMISNWDNLPQT